VNSRGTLPFDTTLLHTQTQIQFKSKCKRKNTRQEMRLRLSVLYPTPLHSNDRPCQDTNPQRLLRPGVHPSFGTSLLYAALHLTDRRGSTTTLCVRYPAMLYCYRWTWRDAFSTTHAIRLRDHVVDDCDSRVMTGNQGQVTSCAIEELLSVQPLELRS
jgi:hypothetical protein